MRFAERHAWKLFFALGVLGIVAGLSDISIAVTLASRQLAIAVTVLGLLLALISATALRGGQRWAWFTMWIWPAYLLADAVVLAYEPTRGLGLAAFDATLALVMALALLLSRRRYPGSG
jgi:hypothetical protein